MLSGSETTRNRFRKGDHLNFNAINVREHLGIQNTVYLVRFPDHSVFQKDKVIPVPESDIGVVQHGNDG